MFSFHLEITLFAVFRICFRGYGSGFGSGSGSDPNKFQIFSYFFSVKCIKLINIFFFFFFKAYYSRILNKISDLFFLKYILIIWLICMRVYHNFFLATRIRIRIRNTAVLASLFCKSDPSQ